MSKLLILEEFIKESFKAGKPQHAIHTALADAGWEQEKIEDAFSKFDLKSDFPIAIPKPKVFASARLLFLNLFYFKLLYVIIFCALSVYFEMIDFYFAEPLSYYGYGSITQGIKYYLAYLIMSIPLAYMTHRLIQKSMRTTTQSIPKIRLYLIYITLSFGVCVMFFSTGWLIIQLIGGGLTTTALLKILAMGATVLLLYFCFKTDFRQNEKDA